MEKFALMILKKVIEFVFGVTVKGEKIPEPTFRSVYPTDRPSQDEWCKQFRLSVMHGKQIVYLDQKY